MDTHIRSVREHRLDREAGAIVYPVISRRSRGLSIGINFFPDQKLCSFDCPYCEVFPFTTDLRFSLKAMEQGLRQLAVSLKSGETGGIGAVRDISFSGNGEPTMHPDFIPALELAAQLRMELFPKAKLVLITNGSGLLDPAMADYLARSARNECKMVRQPAMKTPAGVEPERGLLEIWLKIDAGTEAWYKKINRSAIPFQALNEAINAFAVGAPFIIQTMICKIDGKLPPQEEVSAWEQRVRVLLERALERAPQSDFKGGQAQQGPQRVQLYGKARPAPEDPLTEPAAETYLIERRDSLARALAPYSIPIEVFP
jgi:histidinol dehydrogenase